MHTYLIDWRGWAGTDPYRQYFLGLPFEGPDYIREISDKLISSYIGFDRLDYGPGTLLRALALESVSKVFRPDSSSTVAQ